MLRLRDSSMANDIFRFHIDIMCTFVVFFFFSKRLDGKKEPSCIHTAIMKSIDYKIKATKKMSKFDGNSGLEQKTIFHLVDCCVMCKLFYTCKLNFNSLHIRLV